MQAAIKGLLRRTIQTNIMARLFITLYLMVLAAFGIFVLYGVTIGSLTDDFVNKTVVNVSKGMFDLLDDSVQGLDKKALRARVSNYKKVFGESLELLSKAPDNFTEAENKALQQGQIVTQSINDATLSEQLKQAIISSNPDNSKDTLLLYRQRPGSSQIWRLNINLNVEVDKSIIKNEVTSKVKSDASFEGMFYLISLKLKNHPPGQWPAIIQKLRSNPNIPVQIKDFETLEKRYVFSPLQKKKLHKGLIVDLQQGNQFVTFFQKISDSSQFLQLGPYEIPWVIRNLVTLLLFAFIFAVATALFIWIYPLWSNLIKIKKASEEFGAGNYSARIPFKKHSPIAKVLKAFNAMAEHTQHSIRAQKELTLAVSHELRTPVARMRFALDMLESSGDKKAQTRYIEAINQDIDELDILLEELLSYARFDQKNPPVNKCEVRLIPWFESSIQHLKPLANNKKLQYKIINIQTDDYCRCDPRLMSRVLDNLIQNAFRYAHQTILVSIEKEQQWLTITVEDDGIGIPADKRELIFNAFSRIDTSRDRESGGFGLGLAIVDRIIKAHQGKITVTTSVLGGAKFIVQLPFNLSK